MPIPFAVVNRHAPRQRSERREVRRDGIHPFARHWQLRRSALAKPLGAGRPHHPPFCSGQLGSARSGRLGRGAGPGRKRGENAAGARGPQSCLPARRALAKTKAGPGEGRASCCCSRSAVSGVPAEAAAFSPVPEECFRFPSLIVASTNDPYASLAYVEARAGQWGSELVNVGAKGHINSGSNLGDWSEGRRILMEFDRRI